MSLAPPLADARNRRHRPSPPAGPVRVVRRKYFIPKISARGPRLSIPGAAAIPPATDLDADAGRSRVIVCEMRSLFCLSSALLHPTLLRLIGVLLTLCRPAQDGGGDCAGGAVASRQHMSDAIRFGADGYGGLEVLWEDGERVFCRGWQETDGHRKSILAVVPAVEHPPPASLDRLAHEYGLRDKLDPDWAVRPLQLVREGGRLILVLQDPGGDSLERQIGAPMAMETFLRLAIAIATAVGKVHRRGLVHKDIKPANILVNIAAGEARLTGFGLASPVSRERQPPETITGTLAYMAPEQTGRMNRAVDSRSDLYSLGVTFYQMLTGRLPFTAADPVDWIHCHIARRPAPLSELVADIP